MAQQEVKLPASKIALRQVQTVKQLLVNDQARDQLAAVAAKHMNPERMMRVVANAIRTTPKLSACEPMSFLGALMNCAALGLEPNTPLGHAYLIPFDNKKKGVTEVQVVIGYKGFMDLARRSGQIQSIHADVVYDDDEMWSFEYGSDMHLRHKPGPRRGRKVAAYCHVKLPDGQAFVVLPWDAVIRNRDQHSQGWKTAVRYGKQAEHPWATHEDAMASKTAVRALANRGELPLSIEFMAALEQDDAPADYRGFALDPTAGVTIDGEVTEQDDTSDEADAGDSGEPAQVENMRTIHPDTNTVTAARERQPNNARPKQAQADGVLDDSKPQHRAEIKAKPAQEQRQPDLTQWSQLRDRIVMDLADVSVADVLDFHGPQIEAMAKIAPALHADVMSHLKAAQEQEAAAQDPGDDSVGDEVAENGELLLGDPD